MELVLKINYKMKWLSEHCLPLPLHYASASRLAAICLHSVFRSISSKHFWTWNYLICDLLKRFLFQRIILLNLIHIPAFIYIPFFVLLNNTPHHFEKKVIFILHTRNKKVTFNGKDNCIWGQCIFLALQTLAFWMTNIISTCQNYHNYLVVIIILM